MEGPRVGSHRGLDVVHGPLQHLMESLPPHRAVPPVEVVGRSEAEGGVSRRRNPGWSARRRHTASGRRGLQRVRGAHRNNLNEQME